MEVNKTKKKHDHRMTLLERQLNKHQMKLLTKSLNLGQGDANLMIPGLRRNFETELKGRYIENTLNNIHRKPRLGKSKAELGKTKPRPKRLEY